MSREDELKKAHEQLDALDKAIHPETTEEVVTKSLGLIERLMNFAGIGKLEKSEGSKEEEPLKTELQSPTTVMAKSLQDPNYQEMRDGSEALKSLEEAVTKSIGVVDANIQTLAVTQAEQADTLGSLVKGLGLLAEATSAVLKSLESMPKSIPMSGYFGLPGSLKTEETTTKSGAINFEDAYLALEKGVHARLLAPEVLEKFQARPLEVLKSLTEDTRTKLGIPAV